MTLEREKQVLLYKHDREDEMEAIRCYLVTDEANLLIAKT